MNHALVNAFFLAASIQGFLLAWALFGQQRNLEANRVLSLWVLLMSADVLGRMFVFNQLYLRWPHLVGLTSFLPLCHGPLLYLYVRNLLHAQPTTRRDLIHFGGFIAALLVNSSYYFSSGPSKIELMERIATGHIPQSIAIFQWFLPLYATAYVLSAGYLLRQFQRKHLPVPSGLGWLKTVLALNLTIWLAVWWGSFAPVSLSAGTNELIYLLVSLFIYTLGYISLKQAQVLPAKEEVGPKYGESRLPDELRADILALIEQCMQDKQPWRQSGLTLNQLAGELGLSSHQVSQVLNDHLGQTFNDYINQRRIEAVCDTLQQAPQLKLLDVAIACGFSSKSSFNALFKKFTAQTPSHYRKQVQNAKSARPAL